MSNFKTKKPLTLLNLLTGFFLTSAALLSSSSFAGVCTYQVTPHFPTQGFYQASIDIYNDTSGYIYDYDVSWAYRGTNRVNNFYGAILSGENPYTASHEPGDSPIEPGHSRTLLMFGSMGNDNSVEIPELIGAVCEAGSAGGASLML